MVSAAYKNRTRDEIIAEFDETISILTNKQELSNQLD